MASKHKPVYAFPASMTDCPQCGTLCLGAIALPCGHLTCRRCCRHMLQQHGGLHLTCRVCLQHLPLPRGCSSVSEAIQQLGTDPVMEELVQQQLVNQTLPKCQVHDNTDATTVCEDCQDYFCDTCSHLHSKQTLSTDHLLRLLPTALRNASSASFIPPTHRTCSTTSTDSALSIRNPDDPPPRAKTSGQKEGKMWLQSETEQMQHSAHEQHILVSTVKEIISLGERILSLAEKPERTAQTYADLLSHCVVTEQIDGQTYAVRLGADDVNKTVKTKIFEQRLHDVKDPSHSPPLKDVWKIRTQLSDLLYKQRERVKSPICTPLTVDVMTAIPHMLYGAQPGGEGYHVCTSVACTEDDKFILADRDRVNVVHESSPDTVAAYLELTEHTERLAVLSDGLVAVTTRKPTIYLLKLTPTLAVKSKIRTGRQYVGVTEGPTDRTLLVSCGENSTDPASIDVITRKGDVVRTVVDSNMLPQLSHPHFLCIHDGFLFVSGFLCFNPVFKVDATTGQLADTLTHKDMSMPCEICVDSAGNMYIVCYNSNCVLVRSAQGHWRRLLYPADQEDLALSPFAMCITKAGSLMVIFEVFGTSTLLRRYDLL